MFEDINGNVRGHCWGISMPLMGKFDDIGGGTFEAINGEQSRTLIGIFEANNGTSRGHEWEHSKTLMGKIEDIDGKHRGH